MVNRPRHFAFRGFLGKFRRSCNVGWHAGPRRDVPACRPMLLECRNLPKKSVSEMPRPTHRSSWGPNCDITDWVQFSGSFL